MIPAQNVLGCFNHLWLPEEQLFLEEMPTNMKQQSCTAGQQVAIMLSAASPAQTDA